MITISKKVEYSLVFLSYLSKKKGKIVSLSDVSKILSLPYKFLGQLATDLKSAKIIDSKEGKMGGYFLKNDFGNKTLYDVIEALGENKRLVECLHEEGNCIREEKCKIRNFWGKLEKSFVKELKKIKLKNL